MFYLKVAFLGSNRDKRMADSLDVVLEFLRRNKFTKAEAALRGELSSRPDANGLLQKAIVDEKVESGADGRLASKQQGVLVSRDGESSNELIVKEIEVRSVGTGNKKESKNGFSSAQAPGQDCESVDLYPWGFGPTEAISSYTNSMDGCTVSKHQGVVVTSDKRNSSAVNNFIVPSGEQRSHCVEGTSGNNSETTTVVSQKNECNSSGVSIKNAGFVNSWPKNEDPWKDCSVKTVFPFMKGDVSNNSEILSSSGDTKNDGKKKAVSSNSRLLIKELPEAMKSYHVSNNPEECPDQSIITGFQLPHLLENHREDLPRLPPVKLKSEDKSIGIPWEEKVHGPGVKLPNTENTFLIGSFLDVPVGQDISSSGGKRTAGCTWLSVSQGIAEDTSDLVSGFATVGDESVEYPTEEFWDSDEYDDDEDAGYIRQPIEDEAWFLAHEIDYPSDNEKGAGHGSAPDKHKSSPSKDVEDESLVEDDSYFSGEQYFQTKKHDLVSSNKDSIGLVAEEVYGQSHQNDLMTSYTGQLMDVEELQLMSSDPSWQGFVTQSDDFDMLGNRRVLDDSARPQIDDLCLDDDQNCSVRSIGVGINSDVADIGSEIRESLIGGSSEGDIEYFQDRDIGIGGSSHSQHNVNKNYFERSHRDKTKAVKKESGKGTTMTGNVSRPIMNPGDAGFSFPPPLSTDNVTRVESSKSLWSNKDGSAVTGDTDDCGTAFTESGDMLATWRRKSSDSSPVKSSRDKNIADVAESRNSSASSSSNYEYNEREDIRRRGDDEASDAREEEPGTALEDEEAVALQEQVRQIKAQEEEFEMFNLKIVHRKNRTGFEEDKNFHVVLNSVIAGRYHVTEYLGSAAFSKAIQAHDLHTGMDVCIKIIKNNKDFFDQSLDEIKLLKFVNKHDPGDKFHILRLYDYFYYREHLLIVCELLKANLYEFQKFNRESGGEVYFTMPRLQSITIQCLEALQFLHGLGLIHCDLKPENILVKSYSRCEIKVIDLGSSCFQTDHLCSYVQSRSYRAPEVILGLPYDNKIDIWSLGCILAELCTGNVLFQNDSPATLLARVIGIIGSIDQMMLTKGRDTYKYFTKNHMLYERNQDTNRLEYLLPKKSSLRHRLPMGDQGFIDFVAHLLEISPKKRPSASEALKHPWLSYPYEPISS